MAVFYCLKYKLKSTNKKSEISKAYKYTVKNIKRLKTQNMTCCKTLDL